MGCVVWPGNLTERHKHRRQIWYGEIVRKEREKQRVQRATTGRNRRDRRESFPRKTLWWWRRQQVWG